MADIPVLMFHHVGPERDITPAGFRALMQRLADEGYATLSLTQLADILSGVQPVPPKAVALTFDDGYLDNWLYAEPTLRDFGFRAAVFVVTERVEDAPPNPRGVADALPPSASEREKGQFLSWAELRAMAASGRWDVGSHTHSHRGFVRARPYDDLAGELRRSKALIEAEVGAPCLHLAWPWGDERREWAAIARSLGYRTACLTRQGANGPGDDPFRLKRFKVSRNNPDWLMGRIHFLRSPAGHLIAPWLGLDRRLKEVLQRESPYAAL